MVQHNEPRAEDGIAVVGIGCRFPGAEDHHAFHRNLASGVCSVAEITPDRWDVGKHYSSDFAAVDKSISKWCGQIDGIHQFDHAFFGITPKEARMLDPQQRLLLEQAWRSMEDAGIGPDALRAARTSVHIGVMARDHLQRVSASGLPTESLSAIGGYDFMLANRLSHVLGLTGPSASIDAACASSLVAVHHGMRALLDDEVDFALAGGVSLNLHPWRYIAFSKARMLSPDGRCKTFDRAADGYVPGEGVAVVLMRRLSDALADGDHIYGVLAGSAVNHGGARRTVTAPTVESQQAVISAALHRAGLQPTEIGYVEAHGTGTSLGDPIEVHALRQVFGDRTNDRCWLGSVKPNIGHLEAAAGMAGLVKVLMMMKHRLVPPSIHLNELNPLLDLETSPFAITTEARDWTSEGPRAAGISSFGMGGVNSHIIVREALLPPPAQEAQRGPYPFLLSANTAQALTRLRDEWVTRDPEWTDLPTADISATLSTGRAHHDMRVGTMVADNSDIDRVLAELPVAPHLASRPWWLQIEPVELPDHETVGASFSSLLQPIRDVPTDVLDELLAGQRGPQHECLYTLLVVDDLVRSGFRPAGIAARGSAVWPALVLADVLSVKDALLRARDHSAEVQWEAPRTTLVDPVGGQVPPHVLDVQYLAEVLDGFEVSEDAARGAIDEVAVMVDAQHTLRSALMVWNEALTEHGLGSWTVPLTRTELVPAQDDSRHLRALACQYALDQIRDRWNLPTRRHLSEERTGDVLDLLADGVLTPSDLLEFQTADEQRRTTIAATASDRAHLITPERPYPLLRSRDRAADVAAWADRSVLADSVEAAPDGVAVLSVGANAEATGADVALAHLDVDSFTAARVALWTAGVDLDWGRPTGSRRVPLPVYSFEPSQHEPTRHDPVEHVAAQPASPVSPHLHRVVKHWRTCDSEMNRKPGGVVGLAGECELRALRDADNAGDVRWVDVDTVSESVLGDLPDDVVVFGGERPATETVFQVVRSLVRAKTPQTKRVVYVCRGGAEHTALTGLARSLRRETPHVRLTVLQTDAEDPATRWRAALAELGVELPADRARHTGGRREIEVVEAEPINQPAPSPAYSPNGVYLITGGFGGLGRLICEHILSEPGTTVVLVGRSPRPEGHHDPKRVACFSADVSDVEAMRAVVADVDARFGCITGVIHAAGVLRDSLIRDKSVQDFRDVLKPKVIGTQVLDEVTRHEPLEFFAVFSSVVAALGNLGQTDYATANAFLDDFSVEREARRAAGECVGDTISLAWPLWAEGGMSAGHSGLTVFNEDDGLSSLPTEVGLALLDAALTDRSSSCGYLYGQTTEIQRLLAPAPMPPAVNLDLDALELAVRYVRETVAVLIEVSPDDLDLDAGLDEVGIDSILVSQFNAALERDLGGMAHTLLFECRTLGEVAARIAQQRGDALATAVTEPVVPAPVHVSSTNAGSAPGATPIAIIGMSGRYPQAPELSTFWQNLRDGRSSVTEIPSERWSTSEDAYCTWGAFLDDAEMFDPLFFAMSPREAELVDPQERLLLQSAWHALEDAGYPPHRLGAPGQRSVGVFAGVTTQTYQLWGPDMWRSGETAIPTSTQWSIANRISYSFDLSGPSMPVDTACASSLSAIHLACASLAAGECRMALVGAVNLYLHPSKYEWLCQMQMLSRTGRCHTFGDAADGFVPGEGVGALLLKPLADAVADGDRVHGVIIGTAVNHGGRTSGFTVPNPNAQADLVRAALASAGLEPDAIGYIEAHGTGTPLGDPIEIAGLTKAFDDNGPTIARQSLPIGSVKTNIGHLESAAGLAGLTKVLLQMRHGVLVPSLNAERDNPRIDFTGSPFHVQRGTRAWGRTVGVDGAELPRRAGISSFGAGGANAHVVVEEHRDNPEGDGEVEGPHLVVVSARDEDRLREHSANLSAALNSGSPRPDAVAYQLQVRREPMAERVAFLADDLDAIVAGLDAVAEGRLPARAWAGTVSRRTKRAAELGRAVADRDLAALAELWTQGVQVPWQDLYNGVPPHIELPGYPFARERYSVVPAPAAKPVHPFLGSRTSDTAFSTVLKASDFFLDDHRVNGEPIFPAVGYLEMVRAAVAEAGHRSVLLRNNVWTSAITVPDSRTVMLDLIATSTGFDYEVHSAASDGAKIVHAHGKVVTSPETSEPTLLNIEEIRQRCTDLVAGKRFYPHIHDLGLQLGSAYQGIAALAYGSQEVLTDIALPDHLVVGQSEFVLHPVLFDSALQGSLGLVDRIDPGSLHLPFSIGAVEFSAPLPARFVAHVVVKASTASAKKVEVVAADVDGRVVLTVRDLWLRRWNAGQTVDGSAFRPKWTDASLGGTSSSGGTTLLLAPSAKAGAAWPETAVVAVEGVTDLSATPRTIDPANQTAWQQLVSDSPDLRDIVFAWSPVESRLLATEAQHLLRVLRAVVASTRGPLRLLAVHPVDERLGNPGAEALGGILRVAEREHPRLTHRVVGLSEGDWQQFVDGGREQAATLHRELGDDWASGRTVRHTSSGRQVLSWERAELAGSWRPQSGGTYLVTGGAGRLGLVVASELTRNGANVVLSGRSEADERIDAEVHRLRASGADALYLSADISQEDEAHRLVGAVRERFGAITGVVHAAGVLQDGYVATLDLADAESVLAPKVRGVINLDAATSHDELREFVLFSSVASPLGTSGQAVYAYGNAFLDAFALWRHELVDRGVRSGRTHALNWPLWRSGGMSVDEEVERSLDFTFGIRPLETEQGVAAMSAMLAGPPGQVLFVPGDGAKVAAQLGMSRKDGGITVTPVPEQQRSDHSVAVSTSVIAEIAAIVKLDPSRIKPSAEISDYGFDSLSFTRLANRINELYGIDVTPALFFEHTSVADVAAHLVESYPAELDAALGTVADSATAPQPSIEPIMPAVITERVAPAKEPIAIVGMHGVMPQSDDLTEFWDNLISGRDMVTEIPSDRWDWREYYSPTMDSPGKTNSKWGGFLRAVDEFDHRFFGISPREAALMDPQQRIFLQTAYTAIEEAGYRPSDLANGRTGLFVGVATHDYYELLREAGVPVEAYTTTGMFHAILANRVSYLLNLKGPSFPIDTACSSSLVAVRSAVEAIWSGSCDAAIAGGVNLLIAPMIYISFARAGMLSPTGRCRTFDEAADGYVRGEGAGALLLKPLSAALRDGDHVHAVIRGSAVNHGGRVNTLTTPNPNAQSELIVQAFQESDVDPESVAYMEMHGTGTALGDPIEFNGLKKAFRVLRDQAGQSRLTGANTVVGSVKTNIGHLEAAAGMAGIFKVVLAMKHGRIPGNLHLENLNPHIKLGDAPFRIADTTTDWPAPIDENGERRPRRAGVSSFGFGGVNGHVLLEEHVERQNADLEPHGVTHVFVLSARSADRLRSYAANLADALGTGWEAPAVNGLEALRGVAADLLGVPANDVGVDEPLIDLGFEGTLVADLRAAAQEEIGLPPGEVVPSRTLRQIAAYAPASSGQVSLRDLAFTLQLGRTEMASRLAVVADSEAALVAELRTFADSGAVGRNSRHAECDPGAAEGPALDPSRTAPAEVAEHWVRGAEVDWVASYQGTRPRRLSLPTYPFAHTRHWVPAAQPNTARPPAVFSRRIDPSDRVVAEHRVQGEAVLPGVAQLDLVAAALEQRGMRIGAVRDIAWLSPVVTGESAREVQVRLTERDDRIEFEVLSERDGREVVHSRGACLRESGPGAVHEENLADLLARCETVVQHDEIYRAFADLGLEYGPYFRAIDDIRVGPGVAVARFSTSDDPEHLRTPVLDAALQSLTAASFARPGGEPVTRLPFSVARFDVSRPLPTSGHVVVRDADGVVDIRVVDHSGLVCATFGDVVVRAMTDPLAGMVFTPRWVVEPAVGGSLPTPGDSCLIVAPEHCFGLDSAIAAHYSADRVHHVRLGARTRKLGDRTWEIADDESAFAACIDEIGDLRDVWFLGGVRTSPSPEWRRSDPVVTFFRLVRALNTSGKSLRPPALRLVVNDVHDLDGRRVNNSAGGGLVGFAGSLAKENPGCLVSCTDIGVPVGTQPAATDIASVAADLMTESGSTEVGFADGVRRVRRLQPTALPQGLPSPFRDKGVYVIVGGTGGIGQVLAKHLASTASAGVALIGRSPRSAATDAVVDELIASGGRAVYLSADVADANAMRAALDEVKRTFGAIHGVVHAGMVLRDGIVDRMTEADLADVVRPKIEGSRVLADLLVHEPLDFMLFLSSIQSFTASAGQANYAAASTGQDAIARELARRADYRVRVVNWGYWGSIGRVATDEHRQALAARGFHSIAPHEGIAAVERVLAGDEQQVVVVKADHRGLRAIQAEDGVASAAPRAGRPADLGTDATAVRRQADRAIAAAVLTGFRDLGLWSSPGHAHARETLLATAGVAARFGRLVEGLVHLMLKHGVLEEAPAGLVVADLATDPVVVSLADLRARHPELRARLALVQRCLDVLAEVLTGRTAATEVLFPAGSTDLVAPIYQGDPLTDYCNDLVAKQVAAAARKAYETGRPVEVLEIGGGTGGTTRAVLRELATVPGRVRYTFTDVSPRFLRQAEHVLRAENAEMRFEQYDVTRPAPEQGIALGAYDIVVAANVLHATPDMDSTLRAVRALLVDAGELVLTEVTTVEAFHMITFGLLDGWWNFTDPLRRLAHSPLLDPGMWRDRLLASGFDDVRVEGTALDAGQLTQRVIVGVASGTVAAAQALAAEVPVPRPAPEPLSQEGPAASGLVELLCELTAKCLEMDVSEVDADATLSAYGVDSIVGVELITKINAVLGVVVRTIALFDHPTITELAAYLAEHHQQAVSAWLDQNRVAVIASPVAPPVQVDTITLDASAPAQRNPITAPAPLVTRSGQRAVRFVQPGDPSGLVIAEHVPLAPGPGEVEVLVRAFPINFSDFLLAKGLYPMMPEFPFTPGVEVSGVIGRVGPGVARVAPGDEVIALTRPEMGGQATSVITDETFVVRKPANVTHEEACGFPVAFLAMYLAFEKARPQPGERVLIPAATGTNGLIALQLARLAGAEVVATAGGRAKVDHLLAMGVRDVIDHNEVDFAEEVLHRTGGRGVDVVINALGDGALQKGLNVLAPEGRYVEIAVFGLQASGAVDLSRLVDNQSFHSFNTKKFFLRHPERRTAYLDVMAEHLASGEVRPTVAQTFQFDRVADAYAAKQDRGVIGRVVVSVPEVTTRPVVQVSERAPITPRTMDIAVIGMSGRFAGAADVDQLWENLANGVDSVREVPADRWSSARFFDPDQSRMDTSYCKWGGFLDDVDRFDAAFFSISGKEAAHTDPQQRLFLEEAWKAIQDSGTPAKALNGTRCGVFVGVGPSEYLTRMNKAGATRHAQVFWGNEASVLAARISYFLNLRGPSVAINTACSSSLVALHLACQSLVSGETDVAIAGGVFLTLAPDYLVVASNGTMLSPNGRCRTFDDDADGFAPGEGVGALVLKPLARALADGDRIHGVIRGTATNQDGKTNGITAPSGRAQTEVELAAYDRAGIRADSIGYVEAHGTGTKLGDPIEVDALTAAFRKHTDRVRFVPIGSIKTNIGHTAAAAGIAGLIKVLLSLRENKIPPSLHYRTPNQHIDFAGSPFFVNTELRDWPRVPGEPRRAAVSSFGFSGTNAHVVVEEPPVTSNVRAPSGPLAVPISARTADALREGLVRLRDWLSSRGSGVALADIAYTCQVRRDHFTEHRAVYVVANQADLLARLRAGDLGQTVEAAGVQGVLAQRYLGGETVDWTQEWPGEVMPPVSLPGYAFDRTRHWFTEQDTVYADRFDALLHVSGTQAADTVRVSFTGADLYLRDHVVNGAVVVPAALHLEAAVQAAQTLGVPCDQLSDVVWLRPLLVGQETAEVLVRFGSGGRFAVLSTDAEQTVHVEGVASPRRERVRPAHLLGGVDGFTSIDPSLPYQRMSGFGLEHGPSLVVLGEVAVGDDRAMATVRLPDNAPGVDTALLHPALLDGAMQLLAAFGESQTAAGIPFAVERITRWAPLRAPAQVVATIRPGAAPAFDIRVHDEDGAVLVELINLTIKAVGGATSRTEERLRVLLEQVRDGGLRPDQANAALEAILGD